MRPAESNWNAVQKAAKRGYAWRSAFMLTGLAAFVWLWSDLNAMRLYTIAQAPVGKGVVDVVGSIAYRP